MGYKRTYRVVIPVEPGTDVELLRWLTRESFERKALGDSLRLVEYSESVVPLDRIPPKAADHLPLPLSDYEFREFVGVGEVDDDVIAWLTAEDVWLKGVLSANSV